MCFFPDGFSPSPSRSPEQTDSTELPSCRARYADAARRPARPGAGAASRRCLQHSQKNEELEKENSLFFCLTVLEKRLKNKMQLQLYICLHKCMRMFILAFVSHISLPVLVPSPASSCFITGRFLLYSHITTILCLSHNCPYKCDRKGVDKKWAILYGAPR